MFFDFIEWWHCTYTRSFQGKNSLRSRAHQSWCRRQCRGWRMCFFFAFVSDFFCRFVSGFLDGFLYLFFVVCRITGVPCCALRKKGIRTCVLNCWNMAQTSNTAIWLVFNFLIHYCIAFNFTFFTLSF